MAFSLFLSFPIWARKVGNFPPLSRRIPSIPLKRKKKKKYIYIYVYVYIYTHILVLFIWLCWVLVVHVKLLVVACRLLVLTCGI